MARRCFPAFQLISIYWYGTWQRLWGKLELCLFKAWLIYWLRLVRVPLVSYFPKFFALYGNTPVASIIQDSTDKLFELTQENVTTGSCLRPRASGSNPWICFSFERLIRWLWAITEQWFCLISQWTRDSNEIRVIRSIVWWWLNNSTSYRNGSNEKTVSIGRISHLLSIYRLQSAVLISMNFLSFATLGLYVHNPLKLTFLADTFHQSSRITQNNLPPSTFVTSLTSSHPSLNPPDLRASVTSLLPGWPATQTLP